MRNPCPFLHGKTKRDLVRSLFNAGFLNSLTIDILELIILPGRGLGEERGACPGHYRMFTSIPDLYLPNDSSTTPQSWQSKLFLDIAKCPMGQGALWTPGCKPLVLWVYIPISRQKFDVYHLYKQGTAWINPMHTQAIVYYAHKRLRDTERSQVCLRNSRQLCWGTNFED